MGGQAIGHDSDAWLWLAPRSGTMRSCPEIGAGTGIGIAIALDGESSQARNPSSDHDSESPTPIPMPIPRILGVWPCLNKEGSLDAHSPL